MRASEPKLDDITICVLMGVCPRGLFDEFTREAWRLFNVIRSGGPWPVAGGFADQPTLFVKARAVFVAELAQMERERQALNAAK